MTVLDFAAGKAALAGADTGSLRTACSICGHKLRLAAAGRTDTGVHALCQVATFRHRNCTPHFSVDTGVNAHLPRRQGDIGQSRSICSMRVFSAAAQLQYLLVNRPAAPAVMAGKAGWYYKPLNVDLMQTAAAYLIGEHDSAHSCRRMSGQISVKQLLRAEVKRMGGPYTV